MNRRLTLAAFLILALVSQGTFIACFTRTTQAATAPRYIVVDLGTFGGSFSYAQAIYNRGQITGASSLPGDPADSAGNPIFHAFLYRNGHLTDLGTLGGATSVGNAINEAGQVAGDSFLPGNLTISGGFVRHAFLFSAGGMTDLGTLGGPYGSSATGINNSGQVVGQAELPSGSLRGFIYENGVMQEIPTPTSDYTVAYAINNGGLAVGTMQPHGSTQQRAFAYDSRSTPPQLNDLGTLGGNFCQAISVNDAGWIAGESSLSGPPESESLYAFVYRDGNLLDLGTLPGDSYSSAAHINAAGQIVGWSASADAATYRGFLWSNGVMQDLNTLIPADSGWQISFANGINDLGQIVGVGVHDGQFRAVLLSTPASSISNLASLVQSFNLPFGIANSMLVKLQQAQAAVNAGDLVTACSLLGAFSNQVSAQAGHQIPPAQANQLLLVANQLRDAWGCQ
jgi:probable HAF family extracellular repeat protein